VNPPDLLALRLEALKLDIHKVEAAVERAEGRGRDLEEAREHLKLARRSWRTVRGALQDLMEAMGDDPRIGELLEESHEDLATRLLRVSSHSVEPLGKVLGALNESLEQATGTAVQLDDCALQSSLEGRCSDLIADIEDLLAEVSRSPGNRTVHWAAYQRLLDGTARPIFVEYVDFFAGLTLRDTGLDDRVCEMTDALLRRFKLATQRSLPLPARQAALGVALHSVILLGFPEWSIWGVPLAGHEVGLAYADEKTEDELRDLVRSFVSVDGQYSEMYVRQLFADAFATYTQGLSYACAALLLRLSPRHDAADDPDMPADIDRARVILLMLEEAGELGGSLSDAVEHLRTIWMGAVRAHAGPGLADEAEAEALGPPAEVDWLDDFTRSAIAYFRRLPTVVPAYDQIRWDASTLWAEALLGGEEGPGWTPVEDAVPDVLTAAWRLRLGWRPAVEGGGWELRSETPLDPVRLAENVKHRWSRHRREAR
jgi:hypothetical protein